jgi:hypothetical protein
MKSSEEIKRGWEKMSVVTSEQWITDSVPENYPTAVWWSCFLRLSIALSTPTDA